MNITTTTALSKITPDKKIKDLLTRQKITPDDIESLTPPERHHLEKIATKTLAKLTGAARDNFINKIDAILPASTKNSLWEHNHVVITSAISNFIQQHGVMPTSTSLVEQTGLSRQTVSKHLKEYHAHPEFVAQTEQFKMMSNNVLAKVFKFASNGDIRAARLYFEMVGALNKQQPGTVVNAQNNYIQINNTILSQENLKQLSAEQLEQIENIIINKACKVIA